MYYPYITQQKGLHIRDITIIIYMIMYVKCIGWQLNDGHTMSYSITYPCIRGVFPMACGFAHHAEACGGIKQRAKRLRVDPYTYWCLTLLMEDLGGVLETC